VLGSDTTRVVQILIYAAKIYVLHGKGKASNGRDLKRKKGLSRSDDIPLLLA
jgi:hypothetical protein